MAPTILQDCLCQRIPIYPESVVSPFMQVDVTDYAVWLSKENFGNRMVHRPMKVPIRKIFTNSHTFT